MMSNARFQQLMANQTAVAKKVYEHVPSYSKEPLPTFQIGFAISAAQGGKGMDLHVLSGCLKSLERSGLIKEVSDNVWIREPVKRVYTKRAKPEPVEPPKEPEVKAEELPTLDQVEFDDEPSDLQIVSIAETREKAISSSIQSAKSFEERLDEMASELTSMAAVYAGQMKDMASKMADLATEMAVAKKAESELAAKMGKLRELRKMLEEIEGDDQ